MRKTKKQIQFENESKLFLKTHKKRGTISQRLPRSIISQDNSAYQRYITNEEIVNLTHALDQHFSKKRIFIRKIKLIIWKIKLFIKRLL